jgi:hypothetical protein
MIKGNKMNRLAETKKGAVVLYVANNRYVFTLGGDVIHSLSVQDSTIDRVNAHWEGLLNNLNG